MESALLLLLNGFFLLVILLILLFMLSGNSKMDRSLRRVSDDLRKIKEQISR
jgi:hypothetical protein